MYAYAGSSVSERFGVRVRVYTHNNLPSRIAAIYTVPGGIWLGLGRQRDRRRAY